MRHSSNRPRPALEDCNDLLSRFEVAFEALMRRQADSIESFKAFADVVWPTVEDSPPGAFMED